MVEVVEPADSESAAIQYLAAALGSEPGFEDVAVVGSLPAASDGYEPPPEAVVVRLTGCYPRDEVVDVHQLTLTAWAAAPAEEIRASAIARRAGALIRAAELLGSMAGVTCSRVQNFSFYNDPDPITGRARYSATYAVSLRGQVVRAS